MKLHFVWIGKTKDRHCRALVSEYVERIGHFASLDVTELKEVDGSSDTEIIAKEGAKLIDSISRDEFVVALDEAGEQMDSREFAETLRVNRDSGVKRMAFVVGGFAGLSSELKDRANLKWSLSHLTLTHEMARAVLAEQVYRAFTLLAGQRYHR
jgi:23S rRNA (pseudouridine1915-N3)-methyltransferase